jgi:lysine/ornithine N-monooxygenase
MIIVVHNIGNNVFEFQSFLKQNDFGSKPSFDWSLELSWEHTTMQTCFVPLLITLLTLFSP